MWLVRRPRQPSPDRAAYVRFDGSLVRGMSVSAVWGVPAFWLNLVIQRGWAVVVDRVRVALGGQIAWGARSNPVKSAIAE